MGPAFRPRDENATFSKESDMSFGLNHEESPKEQCFKHVRKVFLEAWKNGGSEVVLDVDEIISALEWSNGRHKVVNSVLLDCCAIFYDAGGKYSYEIIGFPKFRSKIDNIYGRIVVRFGFDPARNLENLLSRPVRPTSLEIVEARAQKARVLDVLKNFPKESKEWLAASKVAGAYGITIG